MANTPLTPTAVTRKAQQILHGRLVLAKRVNRQYDDSFAKNGAKIGEALKIRLPNKYALRTGKNFNAQDTAESSVTLTVATQAGVDMTFSTAELTTEIDDFSERIIEPAVAIVASAIENSIAARYIDVANIVGTPGTLPSTMLTILEAGARLDENLAPRDSYRTVALAPRAMAGMVDGYKGLFQRDTKIANQYDTGLIEDMATGFKWGMTPTINSHVNSAGVVTSITVNDAAITNGDTTVTVATTTTAYSVGTVVTFAGCYAINEETKVPYTHLKPFVVTAATATVLTVDPPIYYSSGSNQNCSAVPTNGGAVAVLTGAASQSTPQHLAFHRDWLALATADLEDVSKFGAWGAREVFEGISIRIARQYDINSDNIPCRLDVLYGVKTLRQELAVRITG